MKNWTTWMALAMCFALLTGTAFAQEPAFTLVGCIVEINEDGIRVSTDEWGDIVAVLSSDAQAALTEADALTPGTWVALGYNGQMTRSLPAQIYAQTASVTHAPIVLAGEIITITQDGLLVHTEAHGDVLALTNEETVYDLDEGAQLAPGGFILIEYDGKLTRSNPAQLTATRVTQHMLAGVVTGRDEEANALLLDTEANGTVCVYLPETLCSVAFEGTVLVYYNGVMTLSLPAAVSAAAVISGPAAQ